jgi:polar amino acid transport system substrate-binding protein
MATSGAFAQNKTIKIAALDWPPYEGPQLPKQGGAVEIVRQAFRAAGYEIQVDFFPWSRAMKVTEDPNSDYMAVMFAYFSKERAKNFEVSDLVLNGPIGFAQRSNHKVNWNSIDDLLKFKIGVVQDYVNTPELDKRIATKQQPAEFAMGDALNLSKLQHGRMDLAVVDSYVFNYLMKKDKDLSNKDFEKLEMNPKILENKGLYVLFKKNSEGKRLTQIFNKKLKTVDKEKIIEQTMCGSCY